MPEHPEIAVIAGQMDRTLRGKEVANLTVFQPKCLNRAEKDYRNHLPGRVVENVRPLGKWLEILLKAGRRLLVSLGMGGEICFFKKGVIFPSQLYS